MIQVSLSKREVELICEAIQISVQACEENEEFDVALEWRHLAAKFNCELKNQPEQD